MVFSNAAHHYLSDNYSQYPDRLADNLLRSGLRHTMGLWGVVSSLVSAIVSPPLADFPPAKGSSALQTGISSHPPSGSLPPPPTKWRLRFIGMPWADSAALNYLAGGIGYRIYRAPVALFTIVPTSQNRRVVRTLSHPYIPLYYYIPLCVSIETQLASGRQSL